MSYARAYPLHNQDVAAILDEIADLLELSVANPFRVRAYRNAARTVLDLGREVRDRVEAGDDLAELPGIGRDLADQIREMVLTGESETLRAIREKTPPALAVLLRLPGLGSAPFTAGSNSPGKPRHGGSCARWTIRISRSWRTQQGASSRSASRTTSLWSR